MAKVQEFCFYSDSEVFIYIVFDKHMVKYILYNWPYVIIFTATCAPEEQRMKKENYSKDHAVTDDKYPPSSSSVS